MATTTATCQPATASRRDAPPAPRLSSSGCAATTTSSEAGPSGGVHTGTAARRSLPVQVARGVPGAGVVEAGGHHARVLGVGEQVPSEGRLVALGVLLAQVELQVRDPGGVLRLADQRTRAERVLAAVEHLLGRAAHDLPDPEGQGRTGGAVRPAVVDAGGRLGEQASRPR